MKWKLRLAGQFVELVTLEENCFTLEVQKWTHHLGRQEVSQQIVQIHPSWDYQAKTTTAERSDTSFLLIKQQSVNLAEQSFSINLKQASKFTFSRLKRRH